MCVMNTAYHIRAHTAFKDLIIWFSQFWT